MPEQRNNTTPDKKQHLCHGFDTVFVQFREGSLTAIRGDSASDMKQLDDE